MMRAPHRPDGSLGVLWQTVAPAASWPGRPPCPRAPWLYTLPAVLRQILVVWAGRHQRGTWEELCQEYRRRIGHHLEVRDVPVRVGGSADDRSRRRRETEALVQALPDPGWAVALDRKGRMKSSRELSQWLARLRQEWSHPLIFLLGSDLGLDPEVLRQARQTRRIRETLSLGPLTLPHELARLLLYEQLYRSLAMESGINYHRQPL